MFITLHGTEFEVRLRNELKQKAVAICSRMTGISPAFLVNRMATRLFRRVSTLRWPGNKCICN